MSNSDETCACEGEHPEWNIHHPLDCARYSWEWVFSNTSISKNSTEPITPEDDMSDTCEWEEGDPTAHGATTLSTWETGCNELYVNRRDSAPPYCGYCGGGVILPDDQPEFEAGNVIYMWDRYIFIRRVSNANLYVITPDKEEDIIKRKTIGSTADVIGTFRPTEEALKKVPEWVRGELVVEDHGVVHLWTGSRSVADSCYSIITDSGRHDLIGTAQVTETDIIIPFHWGEKF